jgi:hypothetical protein
MKCLHQVQFVSQTKPKASSPVGLTPLFCRMSSPHLYVSRPDGLPSCCIHLF